MKKLLLCALLSFTAILPTLAEDLVLTFSPEYCYNEQVLPTDSKPVTVQTNGYVWTLNNFWHTDENMTSVQCGKKSSSEITSKINLANQTINMAVSEVIIHIDNPSIPDHINSISLEVGQFPNVPDEVVTLPYEALTTGELSLRIEKPQPDMYYTINIKSNSWTYSVSEYLQISKVVYKELVEQTDVTLAWSVDKVTATLGDDEFVAPVLTCDPDDEAVKELIKYTSSDENVATINAAGELTLLAPGTTTISASIAESDAVAAATATYELTVESDPNTMLLVFNSSTLSSVDDSAQSWKIETADGSWTITNFSVNENEDGITSGSDGTRASISADFPIDEHLKEIVLTISGLKEDAVDNITLYAYSKTNTNHPIETITVEQPAKSDIVFDVTAQPGLKYSIVVNCNATDAAGAVTISKIAYCKATDVDPATQAKLYVSENDSPTAEFAICDDTVYKSNDNWVVLKFDTPDNHSVWHRFVNGNQIIEPVAKAPSFISRATADADRHGFTQYAGQSFKHVDNGALEYYTENADGTRSDVNSVVFSGVTSVDEIDCDDSEQPAEYYNLQGIRIERPAATGTYIVRRGNKTEKVFISRGGATL